MVSEEEIQQLKSENELLQLQLQDITEIINVREEEIELLRKKAAYAIMLQSTLDGNLEQISQMQLFIGEEQRKLVGAAKREAAMEDEIIQSIQMEKDFYNIRDKYESSKAALQDLDNELAETSGMYRQLSECMSRIAELESNLEIAQLENQYMKEELEELRKKVQNPFNPE